MSLLPSLAPSCIPPAPLFCMPHGDNISMFPLSSGSPAGIPFSSVSDSAESTSLPPHHPSLALSLSPRPPLLRRSPLSLSLLTWDSWPRLLRSVSTVILPRAVVFLLPVSASPRGCPAASPFNPSSLYLLPLSYFGPLQPLAPPLAPLPLAPAANIALRDEDVCNQTGGVVAVRLVAGGSVPCGNIPSRPSAIVGDGISRPLFLHLHQQ